MDQKVLVTQTRLKILWVVPDMISSVHLGARAWREPTFTSLASWPVARVC